MAHHFRSNPLRDQAGFTLPEMLVATFLSLVALAGFFSFNRFQLLTLSNQSRQIELQTAARTTVDLMAREIRRAGTNPTCASGISGIAIATSNKLQIKADLNSDGSIAAANENITYEISGTQILRKDAVSSPSGDAIIDNVSTSGTQFKYYDSSGAETTTLANIRRVRIQVVLADTFGELQQKAVATTNVDLRNRFFLTKNTCANT